MAGILFIFIISAPIVYYMVIIHLFIAKVNSFFRNAGYLFVQYGFCIVKKLFVIFINLSYNIIILQQSTKISMWLYAKPKGR